MSTSKFFTLKEVSLNNNCPECYSKDGLKLTFKQKFIENIFYKSITSETINEMHCETCDTDIFPVRWTDEIEQVVNYKKRALHPKPKSIKLKPLAWVFIIVDAFLLITVILFVTGIVSF
ncbi:hypothetical protein [Winogradskyella ursingii]|uniref:hypothetical protein n=1 Tax=Winogradskyella ursingii TaxID=2686079 RepID=UPI0015C73532|nr:hypothetical protein [Winogradskyella ursingii]